MSNVNIRDSVQKIKIRLTDEKGVFEKAVALKRLEKYANEIDMVLTRYNKKSCNETMMIKGPRKSCEESTNRKIHAEDLEKTVAQLAKGLGLNEQVVKIMGKHHDIGHTFFGHSGEWWISNILEDYGLGNFCHNTLGARELIYTNRVYDQIIEKIKVHNPNVPQSQLEKIRKDLWLIMDAINAHNGEKPEKEFIPQSGKTELDFVDEMVKCYTVRGYDRKIMPATPEACLMRLADKISYTPLDMIDGVREGLVRDEAGNVIDYLDGDYVEILTKIGITSQQINEANIKKDYGVITEKIREVFINDVIANSTKRKIRMSNEMTLLMGELLNLNNKKAVNNVILEEDQQTYPVAIRKLINQCKDIILDNELIIKLPNAGRNMEINDMLEQYKNTPYEGFIQYICRTNMEDYFLSTRIVRDAMKQSVKDELQVARQCVQKREAYEDKQELGLDYSMKNARIKGYIKYYQTQLEKGNLIGYTHENLAEDTKRVLSNIKSGSKNKNYLSESESIAMMISAKYISTLNDVEFMRLLQDTRLITEEQEKSLTRKYKDIPNLKNEVYVQSNWKVISSMQEKATKQQKEEQL